MKATNTNQSIIPAASNALVTLAAYLLLNPVAGFTTTTTSTTIGHHKRLPHHHHVSTPIRSLLFLARNDGMERYDYQDDSNSMRTTRYVGNTPEELELRQMRYEDQGDDDDFLYYDEDDPIDSETVPRSRSTSNPSSYQYQYDEDDDDEEDDDDWEDDGKDAAVGNFWSNPAGGMDAKLQETGRGKGISKRGPSSNSNSRETRNPPRQRERGSQRKTFRSGNPPPPGIMRDFYDKLFWFGFDPEDTTTSADRTMFGGTRGKFDGMGLLQDIEEESFGGGGGRRRDRDLDEKTSSDIDSDRDRDRRKDYDEEDDEFEYVYEEEEEYEGTDEGYDEWEDRDEYIEPVRKESITKTTTSFSRDTKDRGARRPLSSFPAPSRENFSSNEFIEENVDDLKRSRSSTKRRPGQISAGRRTRSGPPQERRSVASNWFDDDGEESSDEGRKGSSKWQRSNTIDKEQKESLKSPIIGILDTIFQVDPDEVKYQADDYNRRLGLGKKKRIRSPKEGRNRSSTTPRKGYAYRYEKDDNDAGFGITTQKQEEYDMTSAPSADSDIIDVEANIQVDSPKGTKSQRRKPKEQTWEERAASYERVAPKGITAWGADGLIDGGIDARTYAARSAIEEIEKAKANYERKEEAVTEAEQELLQLKRETNIQKKLLLSQDDRQKSSRARDRLRMINFDIEDSARQLRRAKGETLAAIDKLEDIELRHWALLRQFEADSEMPIRKMAENMKDIDYSDFSS